jgi:hypothetical protein
MQLQQQQLAAWTGAWTGENRLWFEPGSPHHASATSAVLAIAGAGQIATLHYDWAFEGARHEGLLTIRLVPKPDDGTDMVWFDSFHSGGSFMLFRRGDGDAYPDGAPDAAESFTYRATGSYPAPEGPDWGWRIELRAADPDELQLLMYNITPDGVEMLAVQADYRRAGG